MGLFPVTIGAVIDGFSRRVLSISAWRGEPSARDARTLMQRAFRAGGRSKHLVSDQGTQFTAGLFVRYLRRQGVRHRYGAVAKPQSVVRMERFWLSLKTEFAHPMLCLKSLRRIRSDLADFVSWFEKHRPHRGLKLRTPKEVFDQRATRKRRNPKAGERYVLTVDAVGGHRSLPTYALRRVA